MTIDQIRDALPNKILWDDKQPGLHLKVSATGKKGFFIYYRTKGGIQRRPKLGEFGDISLAEARKLAKTIMARVAIGEDPKGDWDRKSAEDTLGALYDRVLKDHYDTDRFRKSGTLRNVKSYWENHVSILKHEKLTNITPATVTTWHRKMKDIPYGANRCLELLSSLLNFAEQWELIPRGSNPCALVPAFQEKKRKRYATEDEIKAIGRVLERESSKWPEQAAYLYLLLFTGSRPSAIERSTYDQLQPVEKNGERFGILTFAGKSTEETGEEEVVVIPPVAMRIIDTLPRRANGRIVNCLMPWRLWKQIKIECGIVDLRPRDFRRTFASVALSDGITLGTIGELLNHRSTQTTKIYAKLMVDQRIDAVAQISAKLQQILERPDEPKLKLIVTEGTQ